MANLLEQMAMGGMPMFNPLAALQGNGLLGMNGSPTKTKPPTKEMKPAATPQTPLNFGFSFNLPPSTSTASQQSVIVSHNGDGDVTPPQKKMKVEEADEDSRKGFDNMLMASLVNTSCDECGKECGNALALITHKAQEHNEDKKSSSPVAFKCNECDKEFQSQPFLDQHKMLNHNPMAQRLLAMGMPPGFPPLNFFPNIPQQFIGDFDPSAAMAQLTTPKQPTHIKRQYSSNGKNYCDLCNKEVCNKYFLRTHMLKMHGIVIDENKTVIGNIDTLEKERQGALAFRCDICHAELKSRQLLRQHKQDSHGVMPLATPRSKTSISGPPSMVPIMTSGGEGIDSKCPMCDKRVPSNQLTFHIQADHTGDLPQSLLALPQTPTSPIIECKLCNHVSKEESEHQMHQMTCHPSEYIQTHLKEERKPDPSLLRCGLCQYTTKDQKNMEMHTERHERMNQAKEQFEAQIFDDDDATQITAEAAFKMAVANQFQLGEQGAFKCGVCSAAYPDEASLDAHATVAHQGLNLTVPKKEVVEAEKTIERNSHTSGSLSPASESLPEGFVKPVGERNHLMQSFVLRINDPQGIFVSEVVAQLPVNSLAPGLTRFSVEALPQ